MRGEVKAMGVDRELQRIRVGIAIPDGPAHYNPWPTTRELGQRKDAPTLPQLSDFCDALADATGLAASPEWFGDYSDLLDAMVVGDLDVGWLPPVVALRATVRGKTLPIALPVRNGTAYYSTALFTRYDAPIRSVTDVRGLHAAWVDRQSAAGYLVIRASLRLRGIDVDQAFHRNSFHGSHDAVVRAVLDGDADVGATFALLDPRRSAPLRAGWGKAPVRMLATAGPIPADVIAATVRLPVPVIRAVQRALVSPSTEPLRRTANTLFAAQGFVEADSEHLDPLSSLLSHLEDRNERSAVRAIDQSCRSV